LFGIIIAGGQVELRGGGEEDGGECRFDKPVGVRGKGGGGSSGEDEEVQSKGSQD